MIGIILYPLILIVLPMMFIRLIAFYFLTYKHEIHPHVESKIAKAKVQSIHKEYIVIKLLKDNTSHKIFFYPEGLKKDQMIIVSNDILESALPIALREVIKGEWFWRQNGDEIKSIYTNKRKYID